MNLFEIACPRGAMDDTERSRMATTITSGMLEGGGMAPEETMKRARRMTHVAFRELDSWTTGDGPLQEDAPPPFLVTITVPEAWRSEISRYVAAVVHGAIGRFDRSRGYSRTGGDIWVNVVGIQDGSIGLNGKASTADDVLAYMTEEFRAKDPKSIDRPEGMLLDPMCGMYVRPGPRAITLDHDGETVGFCSEGCRNAYARQHRIEVHQSA